MKLKKLFVKLLISLLIVLTLANFIGSINVKLNYSFAVTEGTGEEKFDKLKSGLIGNLANAVLNGVMMILSAPFLAARKLNFAIASAGGVASGVKEITPFEIFFNKFTLLDANIFTSIGADGKALPKDQLVYNIRSSTAVWYYAVRTVSIALISVMFIWNIIRANSKATSAEQKAVAKASVTDWLGSAALVMLMHIIVIFILNFNDVLLNGIEAFTNATSPTSFYDALENTLFNSSLILRIASLIVYGLLTWQTFKFILIYIQRMLTIVLLVMISPIIPVSYSIDKMRGGKGAALNGWFKELCYNVFIQSLHALVYAALVSKAMEALATSPNGIIGIVDLANSLVAIACMLFIKYAEKMIKTIFGFDNSQVLNTNVFANAVTTVGNVTNSIRRSTTNALTRVATGGPLISFGQNVDGSHIGIGQVAQGFRNNVGNVANSVGGAIRNAPNALGEAAGNAVNRAGEIPEALNNARMAVLDGYNRARGIDNGDSTSSEGQENSETTPALDENTTTSSGDNTIEANYVIANNGEVNNVENAEADTIIVNPNASDFELDGETDGTYSGLNIEQESLNRLNNTVKNIGQSDSVQKEDNDKVDDDKIETIEEVTEENAEVIEEPIPVIVNNGVDSELLNRFKENFKAILNDDKQTLRSWADEIQKKMDPLEKKLDDKTQYSIMDGVIDRWGDDKKVDDFIKSFKEGSDERKYAEAVREMQAYSDIDDESIANKEDSLKTLIAEYNAKGLKIPEELANGNNQTQIDRLQAVPSSTMGSNRVEQVVEDKSKTNENIVKDDYNDSVVNIEPDKEIQNLKDDNTREMMEGLAEIDPITFRVNGKLEGDVLTEVQEDFEARINEITKKMGREPQGIKDIYDNMDKKAQKQFAQYKSQKLNPRDLEGDAKNLAIIERQAKHLGFEMSTKTTFKYSTDGGPEKTANSAEAVILDLNKAREEREAKMKNNKAG